MNTNVHVIFYSMYGHVWRLASAVVDGANEVDGVEAQLFQVPELVPDHVLESSGAKEAREAFADVPTAAVDGLEEADAIVVGTPTRYGGFAAQMRNFWDQTGAHWQRGALVGKVGAAIASTGTQHGGQETTLRAVHTTLLHHGLVIVGIPYTAEGLMELGEVSGGSPYGATTIAGDGSRLPSENELALARFQGRHVAQTAAALKRGRA